MMYCQKILAVIDPVAEQQKALHRAVKLAKMTNASITAFLTIYDFSYEMTTMLSIEERESMRSAVVEERTEWLAELIQSGVENSGVNINIKVVWHNRPFESVIHEVIEGAYDIVIKGTHDHNPLKAVIFTPTDWHLMRKCPSPVLLVKEHDWPEGGSVIAAINAGTEDEAHIKLNDKIAQSAKDFCKSLNATNHWVNAYPGTPVNIAIEIPEFDPVEYGTSVREYHQKAMKKFSDKHPLGNSQTHIEEGLPEDIIPRMAQELDAELVIIGTVGRTGISAALIGNTAEHVIDKLDCDVLTVKPDGFVSPLQPS
ncbi:universal stress protein UspE [Alteromonadaceae bacterium BrNp21-10]|nr:universal stress protein UspE [Alteromonadaceae bacterium BrNp21-10]